MRCPRCNAQLTDDASFCGICGAALALPQASVPEAGPSLRPPTNEATLVAAPWSDGQSTRSASPVAPPTGWAGEQPGSFQASQGNAWQQPPPAAWAQGPVNQPQGGVVPARLDKRVASRPVPRKRRGAGCIWASSLLVLLLAGLVGAWFLGVRPYLHNLAQGELDQALTVPENQILLSMLAVPPGVSLPANLRVIHGSEESMNSYLSAHDNDQVQNLHMTITPTGMSLSFTAYGQDCVILARPILSSDGQLQVTDVQVQGVLALIMSNDELTSALNSNLQNFSSQMTHKITKIQLFEHKIDVQLA